MNQLNILSLFVEDFNNSINDENLRPIMFNHLTRMAELINGHLSEELYEFFKQKKKKPIILKELVLLIDPLKEYATARLLGGCVFLFVGFTVLLRLPNPSPNSFSTLIKRNTV